MEEQRFELTVNIPSREEFLKVYPRYREFLEGNGDELYKDIMTPKVFVRAMVVTEFGMPAVVTVGDIISKFWFKHGIDPKDAFSKQCAGSLMCALMRANGFHKTGTKKRVPHAAFTVAEFYVAA